MPEPGKDPNRDTFKQGHCKLILGVERLEDEKLHKFRVAIALGESFYQRAKVKQASGLKDTKVIPVTPGKGVSITKLEPDQLEGKWIVLSLHPGLFDHLSDKDPQSAVALTKGLAEGGDLMVIAKLEASKSPDGTVGLFAHVRSEKISYREKL